jgi:hypothetical protein
MKRKPIQIFLVTATYLSILGSSIYGQYYTLAAADFLSHNLKLEAFDQDYLSAAGQSELKASRSGCLFNGFQLVTCLFGQSFHLLSQLPSLDQKNLVLRC